jgi:hypothetical protein
MVASAGKEKRYGVFVTARHKPTSRFRSRMYPKTYRSKARAMKVVLDAEQVSFYVRGLYDVRALRGREK